MWTTFNSYQWDLDYTNPAVFTAMAEIMLELANVGVDVLRLDAVPFLWKRVGTNCQNQPEVHELLQAFRALMRIGAPGVFFKAEAIVSPRDLVSYLGVGRHEGRECDLAYHNVLMVLLWSSLASGKVALLTETLRSMPPVPPGAGWVTYVRCHDDIGWAITDEDAGAVGENAHLHRRFLADFYAGDFPGSFARGDALPVRAGLGRGAHQRHRGVARGPRGGARARRRARRRARAAADPPDLRGRLRPRRPAADLHGRRARPAQRPRVARRPGAERRQPLDAPPADGLGGRRAPSRARRRSRAGCGRACGGSSRRAGVTPALHAHGTIRAAVDGQRAHLRACCGRTPATATCCWPTSAPSPQRVRRDFVAEHGVRLDRDSAEPDGRPLRVYGDELVFEPYQFAWLGD